MSTPFDPAAIAATAAALTPRRLMLVMQISQIASALEKIDLAELDAEIAMHEASLAGDGAAHKKLIVSQVLLADRLTRHFANQFREQVAPATERRAAMLRCQADLLDQKEAQP